MSDQRERSPTTVSVVVPTHDRSQMLQACVRSVLAQEDVDLELIVVDDGSSDETQATLAGIGDSRLSVIKHERSRGVAAARNAGIRAARGRWVAFLDDDDLWAPTKLVRQVQAGEDAAAGFVYCGAVVFSDGTDTVVPDRPVPSPDSVLRRCRSGNPFPGGASAQIARRDLLESTGGFDEKLRRIADWDMWIRLIQRAPVAAVDEVLVGYRFHELNMTLGNPGPWLAELALVRTKCQCDDQHRDVAIDGVGFSYWLAQNQRRAGHRWRAAWVHLNAALQYRDRGHLLSAVRSPLGSWAVGLRSAEVVRVSQPDWLRRQRQPGPTA